MMMATGNASGVPTTVLSGDLCVINRQIFGHMNFTRLIRDKKSEIVEVGKERMRG